MKLSTLVLTILLLGVLGALGLAFVHHQTRPIEEVYRTTVTDELVALHRLDKELNELVLRSRYGIDSDYDRISQIPSRIRRAMSTLLGGALRTDKIEGSNIETDLNSFRLALEAKLSAVENFKAHNAILRNSANYAPEASEALAGVARQTGDARLAEQLDRLTREILKFSVSSRTREDMQQVDELLNGIQGFVAGLPVEHRIKGLEFERHARALLKERPVTDQYVQAVLSSEVGLNLEAIQAGFHNYSLQREEQGSVFVAACVVYAGIMIMLLLFLALRVRMETDRS